jgi:annexin A7/11
MQQYNAPPAQGGGGHFYLGVPVPAPAGMQPSPPIPGFDAYGPVESIRKATKGFGTDEERLIQTIAPLDAFQMDAVSRQFKANVGKDLLHVLEKETTGWFEGVLRAKVLGPVGYDVWLVHRACNNPGTQEDILNEVLLCRTNAELWLLKQAYRATYNKDMVKVVEQDLSMKTKRMFVMALEGVRMEDNAPVDRQLVEQDANDLHKAVKGAGTDEIKVRVSPSAIINDAFTDTAFSLQICGIMTSRSTPHLQAVAQAYQHHYHKSLTAIIKSEFSGHMETALLYIANTAVHGAIGRDAELIEDSMKGMGTKDERLIYRVVRAHWNRMQFEQIKQAYAATQSKKGLRARVEGETSGDYKRMLVAIIGH